MGILNLTPDSFSDGGQFLDPKEALARAEQIERDGADLIDIGAESTRPGAQPVTLEEEMKRLCPALEMILEKVKLPVSIDTTKSKVADWALGRGASIINDVSGFREDAEMPAVIKQHGAGVILMHRRGSPETMQKLTQYERLISDIIWELEESIGIAEKAGVAQEQIAIDPGIGFSKTSEQNFEIVRSIAKFRQFSRPVVVGASRKSFLGWATGREAGERVYASVALAALLAERGVHILRVHDVAATRDAVSVVREVAREESKVVERNDLS